MYKTSEGKDIQHNFVIEEEITRHLLGHVSPTKASFRTINIVLISRVMKKKYLVTFQHF